MKLTHPFLAALAVTACNLAVPAAQAADACDRYGFRQALVSTDPSAGPFSIAGVGTIDPTRLPFAVLPHYRQSEYRLEDPVGDYALATMAKATPRNITWTVLHRRNRAAAVEASILGAKACSLAFFGLKDEELPPPTENPPAEEFEKPGDLAQLEALDVPADIRELLIRNYHEGKLDLEGHRNPLDARKVVRMMIEVIAEELRNRGIQPTLGQAHKWSAAFKKKYRGKFAPFSYGTKVLMSLARGESVKYMLSGREAELEAWVLTQPHRSITLEKMFRASYVINGGDVYRTLLTIENILAPYWRVEHRERLPVTLRLKSFMNHLGQNGDDFGAWYHLFGIMLYSYVTDAFRAVLIGDIETVGSHIMSHFEDERQEDFVNSKGGHLGAWLRMALKKKQYLALPFDPAALEESSYLRLGESFTKRLKKLARRLPRTQ